MTNELAETTVQRDEWKRIAEDRGIELERLRAEIERLREVLTIPNIMPDTTSSALFIRTLSEHEKGQAVNAQDLINALMWRVKNQKRELARLHERLAEQDRAIDQLHAAVKTAQELAATRLMEIERLRKDLRECRSHLTDVIASQDRPAIKAAADWLSDWEGTRIDPGSAPEPRDGLYLKALQKIILLSHEFNSERNAYAAKLEQIAHDAISEVSPGGST